MTSPVVTGILFETLVNQAPQSRYCWYLGGLAALYTAEPLLTRVYISNVVSAGEKVHLCSGVQASASSWFARDLCTVV